MNPITHLIVQSLSSNRNNVGFIKAFAFGSIIRPGRRPNDIDLLIIYQEEWQPKMIRQILNGIDDLEIHLIFMLSEEEEETNFISLQECMMLKFDNLS